MNKKYYVYAHIDPFSGKPFYIGKGTGHRLHNVERNPIYTAYVKKYLLSQGVTFESKILHICENEVDAYDKESAEIHKALARGCLLLNKVLPQTKVQPEVFLTALKNENQMPNSSETISIFVRQRRKSLKLTQSDAAKKAGVGLRFIRELESGKKTLRIDKLNQVLWLFGSCLVPYRK